MNIEQARREIEQSAASLTAKKGSPDVDPKIDVIEIHGPTDDNGRTRFAMYWWGYGLTYHGDQWGIRAQEFNAELGYYVTRSKESGRKLIMVSEDRLQR